MARGSSSSSSRVLTGHNEIQQWAEERGAKPACVSRTGQGDIGMVRLEFPGAPNANDSNLEEISWDDFFRKFDSSDLALLVQDELAGGGRSNFNKLVGRDTAASARGNRGAAKSSSNRSSSAKKSSAKKGPAKKASSGRSTARKAALKKPTPKKAPRNKSAIKKSAVKSSSRASASRQTSSKKTAKKTAGRSAAKKKSASRGR